MSDDRNNQQGFSKPMHKGNWACSGCGNAITELPFEPDPAKLNQLKCKACYRSGGNGGNFNRPMHKGNWACSGCGSAITELPFEPDPSRLDQLKCRACFGNK